MATKKEGQEPQPPVIIDGPAATPETETPAPKYVPIKYEGKEFQMAEDAAQAWDARERDYARRLNQHSDELGQLRKWKASVETTVTPKPTEPDLNTLWFENPVKAAELIKEQLRTEYGQRESEREKRDALKDFYDGLYRKHDDLKEDDWVVRGVLSEHFEEIADLPTAKAQDRLADLTRERIIRLTRKVKTPDTDNPRSRAGLSEPATGERPSRPVRNEDDDGPKSLGDVIKARAASRRAAGAKVAARG